MNQLRTVLRRFPINAEEFAVTVYDILRFAVTVHDMLVAVTVYDLFALIAVTA